MSLDVAASVRARLLNEARRRGEEFERTLARVARAFGSRAALSDPTGLPLLLFIVSLFGLLAQPAFDTLIRAAESEAYRYSLETANLRDALEEFVFYNHPSVERRVRRAMEWKAAHEGTAPVKAGGGSKNGPDVLIRAHA